jgi:hypothetical protein
VSMSIFREISIKYGGDEYTVTPSVKLLRLIEGKMRRDDPSFNLAMSVYRMTLGDVSHGDIASIVAELVNSAGANTTADHAWYHLQEMSVEELQTLIADVAACFISPELKGKKPEAPEKAA